MTATRLLISVSFVSNDSITPIVTEIDDVGHYVLSLPYTPGAYKHIINSSISSGVSPQFEITTSLNVTAVPNNISSAGGVTVISWTPYDTFQPTAQLITSNSSGVGVTQSVPNIGNYSINATVGIAQWKLYCQNLNSYWQ